VAHCLKLLRAAADGRGHPESSHVTDVFVTDSKRAHTCDFARKFFMEPLIPLFIN
jgi:hypothetical protein